MYFGHFLLFLATEEQLQVRLIEKYQKRYDTSVESIVNSSGQTLFKTIDSVYNKIMHFGPFGVFAIFDRLEDMKSVHFWSF